EFLSKVKNDFSETNEGCARFACVVSERFGCRLRYFRADNRKTRGRGWAGRGSCRNGGSSGGRPGKGWCRVYSREWRRRGGTDEETNWQAVTRPKVSVVFNDFYRTDSSCPGAVGLVQTQLAKAAERSVPTISVSKEATERAPPCPTTLERLFSGPWKKPALSSLRRMAAAPVSE
ncbi:MAG: hypothetical protein QOD89_3144, partial [Bradyrhizobium sp.]|nr:hypothetical protein [Bradyrhizobium sp.]